MTAADPLPLIDLLVDRTVNKAISTGRDTLLRGELVDLCTRGQKRYTRKRIVGVHTFVDHAILANGLRTAHEATALLLLIAAALLLVVATGLIVSTALLVRLIVATALLVVVATLLLVAVVVAALLLIVVTLEPLLNVSHEAGHIGQW